MISIPARLGHGHILIDLSGKVVFPLISRLLFRRQSRLTSPIKYDVLESNFSSKVKWLLVECQGQGKMEGVIAACHAPIYGSRSVNFLSDDNRFSRGPKINVMRSCRVAAKAPRCKSIVRNMEAIDFAESALKELSNKLYVVNSATMEPPENATSISVTR